MAGRRPWTDPSLVIQDAFIVVIDDDASVRKALTRLLRAARMAVETYASGDEFLATPRQREPDCLVLDVRMPGMTGPQLLARLTAAGRRIPAVFVTGYADDETALSGGPVEVLRKPFGDQELLAAIDRAVGNGGGA
jgi:FixJ family two-component response regulator